MEKLVKGFLKFRTEVFGKKKELFTRLSENQAPRALFITCSDSRVDPTLLTQTDPGELFILRNAGNMVPVLEPRYIARMVVLSLIGRPSNQGMPRKRATQCDLREESVVLIAFADFSKKVAVGQAETTRRLMNEHYTDLKGNDRLIKTTQENVRYQLDHLRTHPSVALLLRKKKVDLHGWVYSISTGDVWVYDFELEQFTSLLDETYPRLKTSS